MKNIILFLTLLLPVAARCQSTTPAGAPPGVVGSPAPADSLNGKDTITSKELDNFYQRVSPAERTVTPYDYVGESDVFWQKRVWRIIDVNEKMNLPFKYDNIDWQGVHPLITFLLDAVKSGEIAAYNEDVFKTTLTYADMMKKAGSGETTVPEYDSVGEIKGYKKVQNTFDPEKVYKYRLKEDWFVDKESSTMQCRIIGIAPVIKDEQLGQDVALCWIYYPKFRKILVKNDVFNPKNDAIRYSWDDLFEGRLFSSYVYKESNVFDRKISDYSNGIDALEESERVKKEIFEKEHDMWSY